MTWLIAFAALVLIFAFVLARGAPYLPTMRSQTDTALDLLDLKQGDSLLELGCGDGRIMRRAAERGLQVVGYELNPLLVIVAKANTWRYRRQVKVIWGDFWYGDWPPTDGIFVFLLDRYMKKLDKKITQQYKNQPIKLVSFAFKIPGQTPHKTKNGVFLYHYN